jgi:hypothetical protein
MASTLTRAQRVALRTWNPANVERLRAAAQKANPAFTLPKTGMAPNVGGFAPFAAPERPPPGTYDPALDAAQRAAGRGFGDLQMDVGLANTRAQDDFALGTGHLQDLLQQHLSDLSTGRDRSHQGFVDATDALGRQYGNLGVAQTQAAVAHSGGATSGALQQALEKRMANQALEQRPLNQQEGYNAADYGTNVGRAQSGYEFDVGQAGLGLSRGNEDRTNTLARAGRENTQFGLDTAEQRWFQATQAGYDPPQQPASQHGTGKNAFRYVTTPRGQRRLMSTGYLVR